MPVREFRSWAVECDGCGKQSMGGPSLAGAERNARVRGWGQCWGAGAWGWVCPACKRALAAAPDPAPAKEAPG